MNDVASVQVASMQRNLPHNGSANETTNTALEFDPTISACDGITKAGTLKRKRVICDRCSRPTPRACICSTLPDPSALLTLHRSKVVVLQHPHESRRKNRSLPLVELCFGIPSTQRGNNGGRGNRNTAVCDFNTVVGRRFGDQTSEEIMKLIQDPSRDVILFFPSENAVSLEDGLGLIRQRSISPPTNTTHQDDDHGQDDKYMQSVQNSMMLKGSLKPKGKEIVLIFLDATWKYAQEMDRACIKHCMYPPHMIRVRLDPSVDCDANPGRNDNGTAEWSIDANSLMPQFQFQPRRFDIRAPPTSNHLCTAECIAWALSIVESDMDIYRTLMKPLDLMVQKWHSFTGGIHCDNDVDRDEGSAVNSNEPRLR